MATAPPPTGGLSDGETPFQRAMASTRAHPSSQPTRSRSMRHAFLRVGGSLLRIFFALAILHAVGGLPPGRSVVGHAAVIVVAFMVVAGPWFRVSLAACLSSAQHASA